MIGRIVEIAENGRHLAKSRGFLTVSADGSELGRVALDEVAAVVASAHGLTYSNSLLVALAERCAPLVVCGRNHRPIGVLWTVEGHHEQAGRMSDQAAAPKPLKKRLWAQIVSAKIESQGATLQEVGAPHQGFHLLARKVRSGDPDNVEAQAARRYWPLLLGEGFRRDRGASGANAMLNYAYTVLRAGTARAVMGAGLHPSMGLAHRQRGNAFALADDLMEPFRPLADLLVYDLVSSGAEDVDRVTKPRLAEILTMDLSTPEGVSPVSACLERLALSAARCFSGEAKKLDVMFDLPVGTRAERKAATKFRQFLLDRGIEMAQFSVYLKFAESKEAAETQISHIKDALPTKGKVHIVTITDKQYGNARIFTGKKREHRSGNPDQLVLF